MNCRYSSFPPCSAFAAVLFASLAEACLGDLLVDDRRLFTAWIEYVRMKSLAEAELLEACLYEAALPGPAAASEAGGAGPGRLAAPAAAGEAVAAPAPSLATAALVPAPLLAVPAVAAAIGAAPAEAAAASPAPAPSAAPPPAPPAGAKPAAWSPDPFGYFSTFDGLSIADLVGDFAFRRGDPFELCPCCCFNPLNPDFPHSWCMDACMKLRQHHGTARTERDQDHVDRRFFGSANERAAARSRLVELALLAPVDHGTCEMHSHYGKTDTATPAGPDRVHAVVGACCPHGFPLLGCWIAALKPECYLFYHEIMNTIVSFDPKTLAVAYLDFGCQYGPAWKKMPEAARAAFLRFVVPWFHARGHTKRCQLLNGGLHTEGAAHVVGEQMERIWPMLEIVKASLRYMGTGRMLDVITLGLDIAAADKRRGLFPALDSQVKAMVALQSSLQKRRAELVSKAAELGNIATEAAEAALIQGAADLTAAQAAAPPPAAAAAAVDPDALLRAFARLRLQAEVAPGTAAAEVSALFGQEAQARTNAVGTLLKELASVQRKLSVQLNAELFVDPVGAGAGARVSWGSASIDQLITSARFREVAGQAVAREVRQLEAEIEAGIRVYGAKQVQLTQRNVWREVRATRLFPFFPGKLSHSQCPPGIYRFVFSSIFM